LAKKSIILMVVLVLFSVSACFEWTEDAQGNLKSVGLPGMPVWTSSTPPQARPTDVKPADRTELAAHGSASTPWLEELNRWRELAGLAPLSQNTELTNGSELHARYLISQAPEDPGQFEAYSAELGAAEHAENASSSGYTPAGAVAALGGRVVPDVMQSAVVAWGGRDPKDDIDNLIVAPFHRLVLLAPWATVAGFGSAGSYPRQAGALAIRGPRQNSTNVRIEFPPDGSTVPMLEMTRPEWPDPLAVCPGYAAPVGVPITLQLGDGQPIDLVSYSLRDQAAESPLQSCAFDGASYTSPDPVAQNDGRELLNSFGAVILIPHEPLKPFHRYVVTINARSSTYSWRFRVVGAEAGAH
jgi:hypothetical protein